MGKQRKKVASWTKSRVAALTLAVGVRTSFASCPPPPEPSFLASDAPVYIDRDIESCRLFSAQITFDPVTNTYGFFWHEDTLADLQRLLDMGLRIAFRDQMFSGRKLQILEYLNTDLNHYFVAIPEEAAAIDRGSAGPGWIRTGQGFVVREPRSSPITQSVARFYGSVSPGPNSHFFTIDGNEKRAIEQITATTPTDQPRWNNEGISFSAFPVGSRGNCADNQVPVWRAFNGGPAHGVESNHRFSTDKSVIDGMVSQGWIGEGIAFCVDAGM